MNINEEMFKKAMSACHASAINILKNMGSDKVVSMLNNDPVELIGHVLATMQTPIEQVALTAYLETCEPDQVISWLGNMCNSAGHAVTCVKKTDASSDIGEVVRNYTLPMFDVYDREIAIPIFDRWVSTLSKETDETVMRNCGCGLLMSTEQEKESTPIGIGFSFTTNNTDEYIEVVASLKEFALDHPMCSELTIDWYDRKTDTISSDTILLLPEDIVVEALPQEEE